MVFLFEPQYDAQGFRVPMYCTTYCALSTNILGIHEEVHRRLLMSVLNVINIYELLHEPKITAKNGNK